MSTWQLSKEDEIWYTAPSNAVEKPGRFNPYMPIQKSKAQPSSLTKSHKIRRLQQEMVRLTANIVKLMAKQQSPAS
uniref:Uncharacterized protein n=1 Tax=Romanomermis culicivorax TaxID=13658 RepID=A0A915JQJ7_ROMCU